MVNYYYWKAPIAPDNIAQGPERRHMSRLYAAIRTVAAVILSDEAQLHKQKNLSHTAGEHTSTDSCPQTDTVSAVLPDCDWLCGVRTR
jgi:hypothetical protein